MVDLNGVQLFSLPVDNYSIVAKDISCGGENDGRITLEVRNKGIDYEIDIPSLAARYALNATNNHQLVIDQLAAGSYTINITVDGQENYLQTFAINIGVPPSFTQKPRSIPPSKPFQPIYREPTAIMWSGMENANKHRSIVLRCLLFPE